VDSIPQHGHEAVGVEASCAPSSSICHGVAFGWQTASLTEYLLAGTSDGPIPGSLQEDMVVLSRNLLLRVVLHDAYCN
jgi:hypothetical protein